MQVASLGVSPTEPGHLRPSEVCAAHPHHSRERLLCQGPIHTSCPPSKGKKKRLNPVFPEACVCLNRISPGKVKPAPFPASPRHRVRLRRGRGEPGGRGPPAPGAAPRLLGGGARAGRGAEPGRSGAERGSPAAAPGGSGAVGRAGRGFARRRLTPFFSPQIFQWRQLENLYFREKKFSVEVHDPRR